MRSLLALALASFALAGCAKFPDGGAGNQFTRLVFRFRLGAPPDPAYRYYVAIRAIHTGDTDIDANGPIPVVTTGSKNGFVEGRPTHYVLYNPAGTAEGYEVHRFATKTEVPDPSDDNPINLGIDPITGPVLAGYNPNLQGNDPNTLGFDITTLDLARNEDAAEARSIIAIQFNILTMNKLALSGIGDRAIDALGDTTGRNPSSFNSYRRINIVTGGNYQSSTSTDPEVADDVYNVSNNRFPTIDIVNWTVEVRTE